MIFFDAFKIFGAGFTCANYGSINLDFIVGYFFGIAIILKGISNDLFTF